jgi:hypothetical protein
MSSPVRPALLVGAVLLAASSVPVALGYLTAPADRCFMGIVSDVPDWSEYFAWMKAFSTRLVIENPLTCEVQSPAFFNLQWLVLGHLAAWLPRGMVIECFRLAMGALFLWLTYRTCRAYFAGSPVAAWCSWLLINLSAGLGWIWVIEKRLAGRTDALHPLDIYVAEPVSFQNIMIFPHFVVGALLLLVIFRSFASAIESRRMRDMVLSGMFALMLGLTHAYDLIVVYGVLGMFVLQLLRRGWAARDALTPLLVVGVTSVLPPAYFFVLTTADPLWRQVLSQFGDAGVFTPTPPHLLILVGLPLVLTLLTWRNVFRGDVVGPWPLLVRTWAVVNLFLVYIPTDYQVHMLSGWQIPLGLLATEGLFTSIVPWLRARAWLPARISLPLRPRTYASEMVVAALLIVAAVPTNIYLLAWRAREVLRRDHDHYLHHDELRVLEWLDQHSADGEPVLASLTLGQHIPGLAGNKVVVGHWAQTVEFPRKRAEVTAFFQAHTSDETRIAILRRCAVRYVVHGRAERLLGGFEPRHAPYLQPVSAAGETQLYRVQLPDGT